VGWSKNVKTIFQEGIFGTSTWGTPSMGELFLKRASNKVKRVIAPKEDTH
jgi:hypothetical protein